MGSKKQMNKQFEMSDLGLLSYYLAIEVQHGETSTTLKQLAYSRKFWKKWECEINTRLDL